VWLCLVVAVQIQSQGVRRIQQPQRRQIMGKQVPFLIGLVISLTMTSTAFAQGPIQPQHTAPYWQVSYWNNPTLSGPPVVQRSEAHLDSHWGNGSPAPGVPADRFSARWTRYIDVAPGNYRFTATADDGIRV
jgi:hypothetical protein